MFTLNKIIKLIEDFAIAHQQINDFVFEQSFSYEAKPSLKYPLLWADLLESPVSEEKASSVWSDGFIFDIALIDLVRENMTNEQEALSDCKLMLNDLLIYFRQSQFAEYLTVTVNTSMKPVRMSGTDLTSGWKCSIEFKFVTDPDMCGMPIAFAPTPPYTTPSSTEPPTTKTYNTQTITGTSMTLPNTPSFIYGVYQNGQYLTPAVDYTIITDTITFADTMAADSITVVYEY